MRNRYRNNEGHRIAQLNRQRVHQAVKRYRNTGSTTSLKVCSTFSLLGAPSWEFVNLWLDFTGTRYQTCHSGLMHIDNCIPCAKFDLSDPEQQRECFYWMNLRIMPASENISKNAKLPTKAEYINHINMCLLFVGTNQMSQHEQAFQLLHNTACRFFDMCYDDRCKIDVISY